MTKQKKYNYVAVIQQYFGSWEDVSEYDTDSKGNCKKYEVREGKYKSELQHDLKEYRLMGYPCRVINRKVLNTNLINI